MDREAEVVGVAGHQRDIAFTTGGLAGEYHGPGIAFELAFGPYQRLATFHFAVIDDKTAEALVLAAAPLHQVAGDTDRRRAHLDVIGLIDAPAGHGADVAVA